MTDHTTARRTIYQRLLDGLPYDVVTSADDHVTFDNEQFDTPVGIPWVRGAVRHTAAGKDGLGRKFARSGSFFVQVFSPENKGGGAAARIAEAVRDQFEGISLGSNEIRFNDCIIREVGPDDGWYLVVVECFFEYDQRK